MGAFQPQQQQPQAAGPCLNNAWAPKAKRPPRVCEVAPVSMSMWYQKNVAGLPAAPSFHCKLPRYWCSVTRNPPEQRGVGQDTGTPQRQINQFRLHPNPATKILLIILLSATKDVCSYNTLLTLISEEQYMI